MNLDDESLLSAYLDEELDPAERLAVEWSVESSPPLAEQLRALATARDATAGLGRPAMPGDLAPSIIARLAADRRRARLRALARPGRIAVAVAGLSSMAASLLFALFLLYRSSHEDHDRPIIVQGAPPTLPHPSQDSPATTPPALALKDAGSGLPPRARPVPAPTLVAAPRDEAREREDWLRVTRMLEQPEVRLVLLTTDVIDASERVQSLIALDPRKTPDFGRISLQAGIVVDPRRPGSAEVFVVPVAEGARQSFLDRLGQEFKELKGVVEERPNPDLLTQLTEVGHVAILQGMQASPLVDPPVEIPTAFAKKPGDAKPDFFILPEDVAPDGVRPAPPPAIARAADPALPGAPKGPDLPKVGEPRPSGGPPLRPDDMVTIVVWVTRPARR